MAKKNRARNKAIQFAQELERQQEIGRNLLPPPEGFAQSAAGPTVAAGYTPGSPNLSGYGSATPGYATTGTGGVGLTPPGAPVITQAIPIDRTTQPAVLPIDNRMRPAPVDVDRTTQLEQENKRLREDMEAQNREADRITASFRASREDMTPVYAEGGLDLAYGPEALELAQSAPAPPPSDTTTTTVLVLVLLFLGARWAGVV